MNESLPQGTETILLVDNDKEIRQSTSAILEKLGYKVIQAGTPDQAIHLVKLTNVHLIAVDVILPGMSGLALAKDLAAIRPGTRVLYFSAHASAEVLKGQDHPGVGDRFLEKPFTDEALATTIRELLDTPVELPDLKDAVPRGTESILIVEDDHATRKGMIRSLEKLGYHVLEAHYADRALTIAANSKVDLVVMDVFLPGISGMSLARTIYGAKPWIKYLFVSGMAPEDLVQEGNPVSGKTHFLPKPFGPDELGRAVRAALDGPPT